MPAGPAGCRLVPACLGTLRPLWQDLFWGCVWGGGLSPWAPPVEAFCLPSDF
jgi:hypothetical protein